MKKGLIIFGGCLIALIPFILLATTVYTLLLPNLYRSEVRLSISEDAPTIQPFTNLEGYTSGYNPYFLRAQFEAIQSKPVLYEVIKRLNLQRRWGRNGERLPREVALKILRNSIQVFQKHDSYLAVISLVRDNPDEAADIANELAEIYRDNRLELSLKAEQRKIEALDEALKEQLERLEAAEERVSQLRVELNIPEPKPVADVELPPEKNHQMRRALNDVETEQFIYNQLKTKYRQQMIISEVPRNPVEIIDLAEPDRRPVSPNLFMNVLLAIVVSGGVGLTGFVFLMIGLKTKPPVA